MVAHIRINHNEVYLSQIKRTNHTAGSSLKLERLQLLQICVELTTVNKQPFAHILHSGYQKLIRSQLTKFEKAGYPLDLKSKDLLPVKQHLRLTAAKLREKIGAELRKKLLSVSVDIVTKNHRSILGICAQFITNGQLVVRCIGMDEMSERHTGKYIGEMLKSCLDRYGVDPHNIVSITTDNASNMRSFIKNINDGLEHQNDEEDVDALSNLELLSVDEQAVSENDNGTTASSNELDILMDQLLPAEEEWLFSSYEANDLIDSIQKHNSFLLVNGVSCAAHSIQLVVKEALSDLSSDHGNTIARCREFCKFVRLQSTICEMKKKGIKPRLPGFDVPTRWSSTFMMVNEYLHIFPM